MVKRVIVQNVKPDTGVAVLNAADPMVARMADSVRAKSPSSPATSTIRSWRRTAHSASASFISTVTPSSPARAASRTASRCRTSRSPPTAPSASRSRTPWPRSARAGRSDSTGIVIPLGWPPSFVNDARRAGRFNLFDYRGATLIADYGHNPDAIQALVNAID